jgi:hypothetical protein
MLIVLVVPCAAPAIDAGEQGRGPGAHPIVDMSTARGTGSVQRVG